MFGHRPPTAGDLTALADHTGAVGIRVLGIMVIEDVPISLYVADLASAAAHEGDR